jgi:hypothetical protein
VKPPLNPGAHITDSDGNRFHLVAHTNLYYLVSEAPYSLFHRLDSIRKLGVNNFIIDLRFCKPGKAFVRSVLSAYSKKSKLPGARLFNFKDGLR